jgi:hypothetical protein
VSLSGETDVEDFNLSEERKRRVFLQWHTDISQHAVRHLQSDLRLYIILPSIPSLLFSILPSPVFCYHDATLPIVKDWVLLCIFPDLLLVLSSHFIKKIAEFVFYNVPKWMLCPWTYS